MRAVIGRVKIKPDRADEALAMIGEMGVAMLRGMTGSEVRLRTPAGPLDLPTHGISDPYLSFSHPSLWAEFTDRLSHMVLPSATLGLVCMITLDLQLLLGPS